MCLGIRLLDCCKLAINLKKWQWRHNLLTWPHRKFFWRCFASFVRFSYWSKFMSISLLVLESWQFFYKGVTTNLETGNTPVWICPISGDWGMLVVPNLARRFLMKCYWMLQNARVTVFTISELLRENIRVNS